MGAQLLPCPWCVTPGLLRVDKHGFPFWTCGNCKARSFYHSDLAVIGHMLLAGMVQVIGPQAWHVRIAALKQKSLQQNAFAPADVARVLTPELIKDTPKKEEPNVQ